MRKKTINYIFISIMAIILIVSSILVYNYFNQKPCTIGEKVCLGNQVKSCNENQVLTTQYTCESSCLNGECASGNNQVILLGDVQIFSDSYDLKRKLANISDNYLVESYYYDYSTIINDPLYKDRLLSLKYLSPKDATKEIARMTYNSVKYNSSTQTLAYCYDVPASEILQRGSGVCSTMSRVNIAMLRSIGIASRQVSGCVKERVSCQVYQAVQPTKFQKPNRVVQDNKYVMGGLAHSWVEVWLPETGWTLLESTAGELHPSSCIGYLFMANEDNYNENVDECAMSLQKGQTCDNF